MILTTFRLYRSGYSGEEVPWSDNQLWAGTTTVMMDGVPSSIMLEPKYGSAAAMYRVRLDPIEAPEVGWVAYRTWLDINNETFGGPGSTPLAWYVGAPSDWPSGLARFPEGLGPQLPGRNYGDSTARGVWTLTAHRSE